MAPLARTANKHTEPASGRRNVAQQHYNDDDDNNSITHNFCRALCSSACVCPFFADRKRARSSQLAASRRPTASRVGRPEVEHEIARERCTISLIMQQQFTSHSIFARPSIHSAGSAAALSRKRKGLAWRVHFQIRSRPPSRQSAPASGAGPARHSGACAGCWASFKGGSRDGSGAAHLSFGAAQVRVL